VVIMNVGVFKPLKLPVARTGHARHARGFTLVEMVVVIAVLAILAVMAGPSLSEMNARQRVQTAAADLFTSLLRTRSEAIRQNTDAVLTPTGAWSNGWTIQVGGTTIDQHGATTNISIAGNVAAVTYRTSGRVSGGTVPAFTLTAANTTVTRCVQVRLSGEPIVNPTCQ
jgi:type IV fimbrial biogenesis protein FimT